MSATAYSAVPNVPPSLDGRYEWRKHWLYGWRLPVMILASLAWWPLGLVLFAFFAWRHGMPSRADFAWMSPWKQRARDAVTGAFPQAGSSGNAAFDEHRAATLRRLEEERRSLDAQQAEFSAFLHQLRRAKDQEEFDRFMASRRPDAGSRSDAGSRPAGQDGFRQDGPDGSRYA